MLVTGVRGGRGVRARLGARAGGSRWSSWVVVVWPWYGRGGDGRERLVTADRISDVWGERTPLPRGAEWPVREDAFVDGDATQVDRWVPGACVLCSHGCGLDVAVKDGRIVGVRGRRDDPINR